MRRIGRCSLAGEELCHWVQTLRAQRTGAIPSVFCLMVDLHVSSQLSLPPCLCSATLNFNPLKPEDKLNAFLSKLPWCLSQQ